MKKDVVFIIPIYNERESVINDVVNSIHIHNFPVCLVDDGSTIKYKNIKTHGYIKIPKNMGQGNALYQGNKWAYLHEYQYSVHFDGDGQHLIKDAISMINLIKTENIDIVLGTRFQNKNVDIPMLKRTLLKIGIYINFILCGLKLSDSNNGLRVLNRNAMSIMDIKSKRMAHASEIIWLIKKHSLRYKEYPVNIKYTSYSIKKGQNFLNSFKVFFEILSVYFYHYFK